MVVVISGPDFWNDIYKACETRKEEIVYSKIDRDIDILSEVEKIAVFPIQYFILDISCVEDPRRVPQAVRKLKSVKEDIRVFIIAPGSFSGNEVMSNLISMGIYDIIVQKDYENLAILPALLEHFENPATYAKAVKWDAEVEKRRIVETEENTGKSGKRGSGGKVKPQEVDKIVGTMVIAVAGTMSRIGTTHTAISIAKFLMDNKFGVAVIELHDSGNFDAVKNSYENAEVKNGMFSLAGMDFYPYDPNLNVSDVLHDDYAYVVLDMGVYSRCNKLEFRRAQDKVVVSGVKDWELEKLEELVESDDKNFKNKYYFTFSDNAMFEFVKSNMEPLPCFQAPYNPQPFQESAECSAVFKEMLKTVLPQIQDREDDNTGLLDVILKKKR